MTEQSRRAGIVETISEFKDEDLIVFAAKGETRAILNVFTDTSCPYCQKLHAEIGQLQAAGITVRYLPYARGGVKGPGYQTLKSVWCAEDRKEAMTNAKNERFDGLPPGDCAASAMVDRGYRAGKQVGIRGTPALVKSNGEKIEGYVPYRELIPQLDEAGPGADYFSLSSRPMMSLTIASRNTNGSSNNSNSFEHNAFVFATSILSSCKPCHDP